MHHEPTDLEITIANHALEGFSLLVANIESDPKVALAIAHELNEIRESIKTTDKLEAVAKKRLSVLFNKIGAPILAALKERLDRMDEPQVDPRLN